MKISIDDPAKDDVMTLLQAHLDFTASYTPACSGHALDPQKLKGAGITFWTARDDTAVVGCVALKELSKQSGEIKSMHTAAAARGRGIARSLLTTLIAESRRRGYTYLCLETGKGDEFAPSRKLYEAMGFAHCRAFGDYVGDDFSYCMNMSL